MKKKSDAAEILAVVLVVMVLLGFSWGVTCGIIKLITMCFGWRFSFGVSTGIWLIFALLNWMRPRNKE